MHAEGRKALEIYREKLEQYLQDEAVAADTDRKFELQKKIEEVRSKIREFEGKRDTSPSNVLIRSSRPKDEPRVPSRTYTLTVELVWQDGNCTLRYSLPGNDPFASFEVSSAEVEGHVDALVRPEGEDGGPSAEQTERLFTLLFGDEQRWEQIFRTLFHRGPDEPRPNPIFPDVTLRVTTSEPALLSLPWHRMTWHGHSLADAGWTFTTTSVVDPTRDLTTTAPANVLIVAPTIDKDHAVAVCDLLKKVWPTGREAGYVRVVRSRRQFENALAGMRPHLLYVYGQADLRTGRSALLFEAEDSLPWASLPELFREAGSTPDVACLNVSGDLAGIESVLAEVPVLLRRGDDDRARVSNPLALAWLRAWLGERLDPVRAFCKVVRRYPSAGWTVHSTFRSWKTARFHAAPAGDLRPTLSLDRDAQKALVGKHLAELARSDSRRVMGLVAYAAPGNAVGSLVDQLQHYLDLASAPVAEINWFHLQFPPTRGNLRIDLEHELRLQLEADPDEPEAHLIRRLAPRPRHGRRPVVWLDWGTFSTAQEHQEPLTSAHLGEWMGFASEFLGVRCPDDIRLVIYLACEIETKQHSRFLRALQKHHERHRSSEFRLSELPPLGTVSVDHLLDFLEDARNSTCDPGIRNEVARRLVDASGGEFDATTRWMTEAENGSWYDLLARLRQDQGAEQDDDEEPFT